MGCTTIIAVERRGVRLDIAENKHGIYIEICGFGDAMCIEVDRVDLVDIRDMITNYLEGDSDESE